MTDIFCDATEFGLGRGFYVATEYSYVMTESSKAWGFLCRDSGARHCVATRLYERNRDALSRQCSAVLHRDREGHASTTDIAERALARQTRPGTHNKASTLRLGATPSQ